MKIPSFAPSVINQVVGILFVSLLTIRLSFNLFSLASAGSIRPPMRKAINRSRAVYTQYVRSIAKTAMYIALIPYSLVLLERALYVWRVGYAAYYVDFASRLPLVVVRVGTLFAPLCYLFLATLPSKRESRMPVLVYLIASGLSLSFGQRNGLMLGFIFIALYFCFRDVSTPISRPWITRRLALGSLVILPLLLLFLSAFTFIRSGAAIAFSTISEGLKFLFISQGGSVNLVAYTVKFKEIIPHDHFYSFGAVVGFINDNIIATKLFGTTVYPKASVLLATEGHSFSFMISYLINPIYYLKGGGYGSSYVAELWADFGLPGVVLGSALYGLLMAKFPTIMRANMWVAALGFPAALAIIYAPRAEFLGFLAPALSVPTLAAYLAIHACAVLTARLSVPPYRRSARRVGEDRAK